MEILSSNIDLAIILVYSDYFFALQILFYSILYLILEEIYYGVLFCINKSITLPVTSYESLDL